MVSLHPKVSCIDKICESEISGKSKIYSQSHDVVLLFTHDTLGVAKGPILALPKSGVNSFWVDYDRGSDQTGTGKESTPFKTVQKALEATREKPQIPGTIILKTGVHFLRDTIALGAADSGLTITRDPHAPANSVWISGGIPLVTNWTKVADTALGSRVASNVWMADLSGQLPRAFNGLNTLSGRSLSGTYSRVTRARFPSGNIEDCVAHVRLIILT